MTIRRKIYLIITSLLILFYGGQVLISKKILTRSFETLEADRMFKNLDRLAGFVNQEVEKLNIIVRDWGHWTECYNFMKTKSARFVDSNVVPATFENIDVQHIIFFDTKYSAFFGKSYNPVTKKLSEPPIEITSHLAQTIRKLGPEYFKKSIGGFIDINGTIYQLSASQILTSEWKGPSRGILVMAKVFSDANMASISKNVLLTTQMHKPNSPSLTALLKKLNATQTDIENTVIKQNKNSIQSIISIKNLYDDNAFFIHVNSSNEIVVYGRKSISSLIRQALVVLILLFVLLAALLEINIIQRIKSIQMHLKEIGEKRSLKKRLPIESNDEMAKLSISFNEMLEAFEQYDNEKMEMQRKVFQTSKMASIGELAEGVGHEINNPLAIVMGNMHILKTKMLRDKITDKDYFDLLEKQFYAAERIATIVKGLKSFVESNDQENILINLNTVIKETLSLIKKVYIQKGITIEANLSETDPIILGNSSFLKQVIINLLSNARDAVIESDNKQIKISTQLDNSQAILKIQDKGHGIPEEIKDRIFESFFTTKGTGEGVGLGLSVSKKMITGMGGEINSESNPELGTIISISFPLNDSVEKENNEQRLVCNTNSLKGKILVVDDEEFIRTILEEYLIDFGFTVELAENGKVALEMIKNKHYDYVITDLKMPIMNGEELIKQIATLKLDNTKILVITGNMSINLSCMHIDGYLYKPFSKDDICKMLTE